MSSRGSKAVFLAIGAALVYSGVKDFVRGTTIAIGGRAGGERWISFSDAPIEFTLSAGSIIVIGLVIIFKTLKAKDDS
jgi:hypothetical protein